ncbi:MAG: DUF5666 domain-containing protein [Chloroflexi bacterium]|nr:DUF5666 domain-containing protein [Chloroflexota bacterium]MDA1272286.1 DUF5666 domain-containing protein [Chloroflexota bacterium]PKB58500.1 MAG: hypothetical protein BZY83_06765 [SAR202 cluster bacterium Casp-Chloro-G2]
MNIAANMKSTKVLLLLMGAALALAALLIMVTNVSAQPVADLDLTFGGGGDDFAHAAVQTPDGGFVVAGETQSSGAGGRDVWLIKTDGSGNQLWTRTFGGPADDVAFAIAKTRDGGLVMAGSTAADEDAKTDFLLIKTDSFGIRQWSQTYANLGLRGILNVESNDVAYAVRQTQDGGYIVAGSTDGEAGRNIWLVKTDSGGILVWDQEFGANGSETAYSVLQTADGGYVVAGSTDSIDLASNGGADFLLLKTDAEGRPLWTNTLGGEFNDEARSVIETQDGGFALAGTTWSKGAGLSDFWLVKTDPYGEEIWNKTYGGASRDAAYGLQQTRDGGYALGGWSESFPGGDHFWVVKADPAGSLVWEATYGESSGARAIQQTMDGGYLIAGWSGPLEGVRDIRLIKTVPDRPSTTSRSGPVVVLENLGSSNISSAAIGFGSTPDDSPHLFGYQGRYLDRNNILPPNTIACTAPISGLANGTYLTFDQIGSGGNVLIDNVTAGLSGVKILPDITFMPFDLTYGTGGGRIIGQFRIASESPCGGEVPSGEPSAPTGLTVAASDTDSGTLVLDWDDNPETNTAGYNVYLSLTKNGPYRQISGSIPSSERIDSRLVPGTEYHYVVSALNDFGIESAKSTVTSGIPAKLTDPLPPAGLRVTTQDRQAGFVELDWEDIRSSDLEGYNVYRRLSNEDAFSLISSGSSSSTYIDRLVPEGVDFIYVVTTVDSAGNESVRSNFAPIPMDFFGTVVGVRTNSFDERVLVLQTDQGHAEVVVTRQTNVQVPRVRSASIADLSDGDFVAVSMTRQLGRLVASKIQLAPSKTQSRQVPGTVTSISRAQITIQPLGNGKDPITFTLSDEVKINFHRGITAIDPGSFVVVGAERNQDTGQLSPQATEINVTAAKKSGQGQSAQTGDTPNKSATLQGVFEGINPDTGSILVDGVEVPLAVSTVIRSGLVAGNTVRIAAEVLPNGSLVALEVVRIDDDGEEVSEKTALSGVFGGVDQDTRQWNIGGALVTVNSRTDTDGLPQLGQRVRVNALLQKDGSLLAREIENQLGMGRPIGEIETELRGVLQGADSQGNWVIGGRKVVVDAATVLSGSPSVGRHVSVKAVQSVSGRLLARNIEDESDDKGKTKREATIRGVVSQVLAGGGLVVDGVRVESSALTERAFTPRKGDAVEIKALLQATGVFLARQIEQGLDDIPRETPEEAADSTDPVDIEGVIQKVNQDGSLVMNGLRTTTSVLTDLQGELKAGSAVRVRGLLREDGVVLARSLRGEDRGATNSGTETVVKGRLDRVNRNDDGSIRSVVVNGVTVAVTAQTAVAADLITGSSVAVAGILSDGRFVAAEVKVDRQPDPDENLGEVDINGVIERVKLDTDGKILSVTVRGLEFRVDQIAQLRGRLEAGKKISLNASAKDGRLVAVKVVVVAPDSGVNRPSRFEIEGVIANIGRDIRGKVNSLRVSGEDIAVEALSNSKGGFAQGDSVRVAGLTSNGKLLAASIEPVGPGVGQDRAEPGRQNEEARSKGEREGLPQTARDAIERAKEQAAQAREKAKAERETDQ